MPPWATARRNPDPNQKYPRRPTELTKTLLGYFFPPLNPEPNLDPDLDLDPDPHSDLDPDLDLNPDPHLDLDTNLNSNLI